MDRCRTTLAVRKRPATGSLISLWKQIHSLSNYIVLRFSGQKKSLWRVQVNSLFVFVILDTFLLLCYWQDKSLNSKFKVLILYICTLFFQNQKKSLKEKQHCEFICRPWELYRKIQSSGLFWRVNVYVGYRKIIFIHCTVTKSQIILTFGVSLPSTLGDTAHDWPTFSLETLCSSFTRQNNAKFLTN